ALMMRSYRYHITLTDASTHDIYTLSLHDALPIYRRPARRHPHHDRPVVREPADHGRRQRAAPAPGHHVHPGARRRTPRHVGRGRSEEHTSELQSRFDLVCRLLLEKKK